MIRKRNKHRISGIRRSDKAMLMVIFVMFVSLVFALQRGTSNYKEKQLEMVGNSINIMAENQKNQFEEYVSEKVSVLQGLVNYPQIYQMDDEEQKKFIRSHSRDFGFHHLFVVHADGKVLYPEENITRNQKDEPFIYDVMNNDLYITEPYYGGDAVTITISVSIYNKNDEKVGALCGAVELRYVEHLFEKNKTYNNGISYLINSAGDFIASDGLHAVNSEKKIFDDIPIRQDRDKIRDAFEDDTGYIGVITYKDEEYLMVICVLDQFDWANIQLIKVDDVYNGLDDVVFLQTLSMLVVVAIFVCVLRIIFYWNKSDKKNNTDSLTGCNSRLAIHKQLEHLNNQRNHDIAIIYFDLNRFKEVNDTLGHEGGDRVLCLFSDVLTEVFGQEGDVGRQGGDEFVAILIDVEEEKILEMCNSVNVLIKEKLKEQGLPEYIETSFGISIRKKGSEEDINTTLIKADKKMYANKGRNRNGLKE